MLLKYYLVFFRSYLFLILCLFTLFIMKCSYPPAPALPGEYRKFNKCIDKWDIIIFLDYDSCMNSCRSQHYAGCEGECFKQLIGLRGNAVANGCDSPKYLY